MLDKNYYNKCSKIEKIRTILVQNQSSRSVLPTSNVGHARHYLPTRWMVIQSYSSVSEKSFANCRSVKRRKMFYEILCKTLQKKVYKINEMFYDLTYSAKRPNSWPQGSSELKKGYLSNLLERWMLPHFFVFWVRDFKFWLHAYFLIFFNRAKFQKDWTNLILDCILFL